MKVLPVRFWLLLLTCAVVTVPALATVALAARHPPPKIGSPREQIPERVQAALTESDNTWRDPEWQAGLRDLLEREQVGVVLLDDQQEVLFTYSPPIKGSDASPEADVLTTQGGQAVILAPRGERRPAPPALPWYATDTWRIPLAQLAALLVIVAAIRSSCITPSCGHWPGWPSPCSRSGPESSTRRCRALVSPRWTRLHRRSAPWRRLCASPWSGRRRWNRNAG